jgi:hypothetical protein
MKRNFKRRFFFTAGFFGSTFTLWYLLTTESNLDKSSFLQETSKKTIKNR